MGIEFDPESEPIIFLTTQTIGMINNMMILPPIITKVIVSKFFSESIRFETFELISARYLSLLSKVRQYPGVPCESMASARIEKGKLSFSFKGNGNYPCWSDFKII